MIFISYSSIDTEQAQALRARLERDGLSCWMAPEDIRAGQDYASEIPAAIANCDVFLLFLTDNAQRSTWVPKELDTAINLSRTVIPFVAKDLVMTPAFVFKLVNVQAVTATGNDGKDYASLTKALRQHLPVTSEKPAPVPEPQQAAKQKTEPSSSRKKYSRKALWISLLAVVLCAALVCAGILATKTAQPSASPEECVWCAGSGLCMDCHGLGEVQHNLYQPAELCDHCFGTGVCLRCDGKGYIIP